MARIIYTSANPKIDVTPEEVAAYFRRNQVLAIPGNPHECPLAKFFADDNLKIFPYMVMDITIYQTEAIVNGRQFDLPAWCAEFVDRFDATFKGHDCVMNNRVADLLKEMVEERRLDLALTME